MMGELFAPPRLFLYMTWFRPTPATRRLAGELREITLPQVGDIWN